MSSPAGKILICNRALQILGAKRISTLEDNTVTARACATCYDIIRESELQAHWWRFAITRAELAAAAPVPSWGRANSFPLPADYLKMFHTYPELNTNAIDYEVEGKQILSNNTGPLQIRYVKNVTDVTFFPALFKEALASAMSVAMVEELTQSNPKAQLAAAVYDRAILKARRANAFENVPEVTPDDDWITARL